MLFSVNTKKKLNDSQDFSLYNKLYCFTNYDNCSELIRGYFMTAYSYPSRKFGLSGSTLKIIAIVTMFIDHAGATIVKGLLKLPAICDNPEL